MAKLAEINTGMNWEIAGLKMMKVSEVLDSAKEDFPHDCEVTIESRKERDGRPYQANTAPFYYLVVNGSADTDSRFIAGIKDVLKAV